MGEVMNETNYRFIGYALLVALVMFLYLDGGTVMNGGTNGIMGQHDWMSFNEWGLPIKLGIIVFFILITFLLFKKSIFRVKDL